PRQSGPNGPLGQAYEGAVKAELNKDPQAVAKSTVNVDGQAIADAVGTVGTGSVTQAPTAPAL
ncbi:MAG: hypothetical protein IVW55_18380, partial [Chloroflexi bacterium]|nr:hypothetical protein [Chloroflexota bacterium]